MRLDSERQLNSELGRAELSALGRPEEVSLNRVASLSRVVGNKLTNDERLAATLVGGAKSSPAIATLAAYLNAVDFGWSDAELPLVLARLAGQREAIAEAAAERQVASQSGNWTKNSEALGLRADWLHVAAMLVACLCALLAVRLVLKGASLRVCRRWSQGSGEGDLKSPAPGLGSSLLDRSRWLTHTSYFAGPASKQAEAEAGNLHQRRQSLTVDELSETDGSEDKISKKKSLLTRKLVDLLAGIGHNKSNKSAQESGSDLDTEQPVKSTPKPQAPTLETLGPIAAESQNLRSSGSYIKSLIEALAKAGPQVFSGGGGKCDGSCGDEHNSAHDDEDDDADDSTAKLLQDKRQLSGKSNGGADLVVSSQMDISAAHLILNYMEKHLDDKEQLRREWLELNAGQASGKTGAGSGTNSSKANQLVLQRLAKVALAECNRSKNRNPLVLPLDRNRVKLGSGSRGLGSPGGSPPNNAPTTTSRSSRQKQSPAGAASDYINASYIYDDDPRRPTHIIAQGPTEQTCGQFWQMIWEQDISVIVMLTRLSENGRPMCHCYWPNNKSASGQPECSATQTNGCSRRGSATSSIGRSAGREQNSPPSASNPQLGAANQPPISEPNVNTLTFEVADLSSTTLHSDSPDDDSATRAKRSPSVIKFELQLVGEHVSSSDYLVRSLYLINRSTGESRTITQFHYIAWPELEVPENVRSFLEFRRKVHKSYRNLKSPILVHCSDGAGRSGTYCLIDIILERIKNGAKEIDPRATLEHLRDQRIGLCSTLNQFEFVLVALAEEIQIIIDALPR